MSEKPFPLSKAPDGYLGTLDLKNLGKNPQIVSDELGPSIEMLDYYLLRNRLGVGNSGPFVTVNTPIVFNAALAVYAYYFPTPFNAFIVPRTETIRLKNIAISMTRAAADAALTLEVDVFITRPTASIAIALGSAIFGPRPATDLNAVQSVPLNDFLWLGAGDALSIVPRTTQTPAGSAIGLNLDFDTVPSG